MTAADARPAQSAKGWTFLTNHAHVLLAVARDPTARLRDVADIVGVTERAAQAIVADLESAGYLQRSRVGRRNRYTVNPAGPFRHPAESDRLIGDLLTLFTDRPADRAAQRPAERLDDPPADRPADGARPAGSAQAGA